MGEYSVKEAGESVKLMSFDSLGAIPRSPTINIPGGRSVSGKPHKLAQVSSTLTLRNQGA